MSASPSSCSALGEGRLSPGRARHLASQADYLTVVVADPGHHHQPLPVLLAGRGGGRGDRASATDAKPLRTWRRRRRRRSSGASASTPMWAWRFSNVIALFIIITTAATLHAHGITDIADLVAGGAGAANRSPGTSPSWCSPWGSSAPACWPFRCWPARPPMRWARRSAGMCGLARKFAPRRRPSTPSLPWRSLLGSLGLNFVHIDPIKALFWSAVINGVVAVPVMVMMMLMASRKAVMGRFHSARGPEGRRLDGDPGHGRRRRRHVRHLGPAGLAGPAKARRTRARWAAAPTAGDTGPDRRRGPRPASPDRRRRHAGRS